MKRTLRRARRWVGFQLLRGYFTALMMPLFARQRQKYVIQCFMHALTAEEVHYYDTEGREGTRPQDGAVWNDGDSTNPYICVQTPGGVWEIDEYEFGWVRVGTIEDGTLTVFSHDECPYGNGSITFTHSGYHARLYRGHLVELLW